MAWAGRREAGEVAAPHLFVGRSTLDGLGLGGAEPCKRLEAASTFFVRLGLGRARLVPPYYGSCCVFRAGKTLHEGLRGDFAREVEGRFFDVGKKAAKTCSVFLHKNVQHAVDEWWISWTFYHEVWSSNLLQIRLP